MHLGNGIILLVGVNRSVERMCLVLVTCSVSFPLSFLCRLSGPESQLWRGQAAFLNSHHKKLEPMGKPEPCLWKNLLPPPGEKGTTYFLPFFGGCASEVLSSGLELRESTHFIFLDTVCLTSQFLHLAIFKKGGEETPLSIQ